jgi:hypothetical protein
MSKFGIGDDVRKTRGSQWAGKVVGRYNTELTPEGYCVESSTEVGSVQIYPAAALELVQRAEPGSVPDDAFRFHKLLGWMSSNVKEGWDQVCMVASVATYVSHPEACEFLDSLPECNVGLMAKPVGES